MDLKIKNEELYLEAKSFINYFKKEFFQSLRSGNNVIKIDFQKLSEHSPNLTNNLLENPEITINIFENAIDETGVVKNPKIILENFPKENKILISEILFNNYDTFLSIEGNIIQKSKVKQIALNSKFECPNCGALLSVLQLDNKFKEPNKCICGWKNAFRLISKEIGDFQEITLQDKENNSIIINLDNRFLDKESQKLLKEGNLIEIFGVIKSKNSNINTELTPILIAYGLSLIKETVGDNLESYKFLKSLKNQKGGWFIFEEFIGKLFEKKGYKVQVTKKTGDYGIDVIALKGNEKIAIQCKLYSEGIKVPNSDIQKALGSLVSPYDANKLIFISTAKEFTENAVKQSEKSTVPVELWDISRLLSEIKAYMLNLEEGWTLLAESEEKARKSEYNPYENKYLETVKEKIFDIDKITTGINSQKREKILIVRNEINNLYDKIGKLIPIDNLKINLAIKMTNEELNDTIEKLIHEGFIFKPKKDFIQILL